MNVASPGVVLFGPRFCAYRDVDCPDEPWEADLFEPRLVLFCEDEPVVFWGVALFGPRLALLCEPDVELLGLASATPAAPSVPCTRPTKTAAAAMAPTPPTLNLCEPFIVMSFLGEAHDVTTWAEALDAPTRAESSRPSRGVRPMDGGRRLRKCPPPASRQRTKHADRDNAGMFTWR